VRRERRVPSKTRAEALFHISTPDAALKGRSSTLAEDFFYFAEQRAQHGLVVDLASGLEFLQQFALAFVQLGRHLYSDLHIKIAFAVAVQDRNSLVADAEACAGLRAIGNFQRVLAIHGGHFDF